MKRETYEYYTAKILKQLMMGYGETMQDNPAVGFTKRVKAGVYDHLSDEDYEDTLSFYEDASAFWNKRPQATPEQLISNILQKAQPSEAIRNKMAALIADSYAQSVGDFKKTKKSGQSDVEAAVDAADCSAPSKETEPEEEIPWDPDEMILEEEVDEEEAALDALMKMSPKEIADYLSEHIYGQKDAIKAASMLLYNHVRGRKRNVLFMGPTGCGKTEIWRTLGHLYANIRIIDSTQITKEGWSGSFKLANIFDGLSQENAEHAIIVFDEFDKFCEPLYNSHGNDYSLSSQNELLKFIEGTEVDCPATKETAGRKVCTDQVSFVFCGSFETLTEVKTDTTRATSLGFGANIEQTDAYETYAQEITQEDLAMYGNVRKEICGRISRIVQLSGMTARDYDNILDNPSLSPLRTLEKEYGVSLSLEKETRRQMTKEAEENRMGVRYLQSRIQQLLDDALFEDQKQQEYVLRQRD